MGIVVSPSQLYHVINYLDCVLYCDLQKKLSFKSIFSVDPNNTYPKRIYDSDGNNIRRRDLKQVSLLNNKVQLIFQHEPLGFGDAVLVTEDYILETNR